MQSFALKYQSDNPFFKSGLSGLTAILASACVICPAHHAQAASGTNTLTDANGSAPDPVLSLMLEKGMITEDEVTKVQAQVDARRTNMAAQYAVESTKWKIGKNIKDIEIFGDLRLRYESRNEVDPAGGRIDLNRFRYSFRAGLRGDVYDDYYYGFRIETSSNPRSSWVSMGTSGSGNPYSGPFGKSTSGLDVGQIYAGWHPESWFDFTVGKMPNPLYTSSLVWSPSINPEGLAERFNYTVGEVDFFANFGQFLYQDENPNIASTGLAGTGQNSSLLLGQTANNIVQVAFEGGFNYRITTNLTLKAGAAIYKYYGQKRSSINQAISPFFGDYYVGEGAYLGTNSIYPIKGASGYGASGNVPGYQSLGYPNNQVGINSLTVLEIPFEINYKFKHIDARIFGDIACNLEGATRARQAAAGYAAYLSYEHSLGNIVNVKSFAPQVHDVRAYQFGLSVASKGAIGLANGSVSKKHAWEAKAYWQHIEQYSLDPNLLDLDFFAGSENMEGIYAALAYGFNDNFIATFRYGHASRINHHLGTGGTGPDIPQINPINYYDLFQVDLTFKF